ncbi:hypothetical protein JCM3765_006397 [Sporobolomyces pararoseus]
MGDALQDLEHICYPAFSSLDNSMYQNPCQIAHILFRVCDSPSSNRDDYPLSALDQGRGQHHYPAPNQWQATECICSMAGYNLVQACAACQSTTPILSTSWNDWVSNCTMSNINFGKTFPYDIPSSTVLPNWVYANNNHGAFSMADTFGRINSNQSSWPFNPSSFSIATASSTKAAASATASSDSYGEANQTPSSAATTDGDGDADDSSNNSAAKIAVGIVIPIVVIGGILLTIWLYVRQKRRNTRQRGFRLGSDNNLPPPSFLVHESSANPFSDSQYSAPPLMTQQKESSGITSLFFPSETVFTRSSNSRSSFTTNSVSTGSISAAYTRRSGQQRPRIGLGPDPYGPRDSTSLFAPSTIDYDSRSSAAYTYDDEEEDDRDESISPFSDLHRPEPTVLASRNNLHNNSSRVPYYSPSIMSGSASETDSMLSGNGRRIMDPDEESVITLSSRISKLSGRAPSSSGATYGGAHDDEDDEFGDEDDGFETEHNSYDEGEETEGGYETEQGVGFETETEREYGYEDDAISLNTTTSGRSHRP